MGIEIDVTIERIDNGYIVAGNDSTKNRTYYPTLEAFAQAWIIEELRMSHERIRQHEATGKPFSFRLSTDI